MRASFDTVTPVVLEDDRLTEKDAELLLSRLFEKYQPKKVLLLPPDATRLYSGAGMLTRIAWKLLSGKAEVLVMPALGTHAPMTPEEQAQGTDEAKDEKFWSAAVMEPDTAIIETGFTLDNYEVTREMFEAITRFETVTLAYPCTYVSATDMADGYFEPDVQKAIEMFLPYREITLPEEQ